VRRDIDRLRQLGYPVAGSVGQAGGRSVIRHERYAGVNIPPLRA
jgi:predicted DNA-binding transcriptional regulator YafY